MVASRTRPGPSGCRRHCTSSRMAMNALSIRSAWQSRRFAGFGDLKPRRQAFEKAAMPSVLLQAAQFDGLDRRLIDPKAPGGRCRGCRRGPREGKSSGRPNQESLKGVHTSSIHTSPPLYFF